MRNLVSLFGNDGGVNCFCFGFAFDYLSANFGKALDNLHRLKARHDTGFVELFGDWLKRAITYNDTDVAGAEKGVYPVVFVAKQCLHRGYDELMIAKDAEVVDAFKLAGADKRFIGVIDAITKSSTPGISGIDGSRKSMGLRVYGDVMRQVC